ncbi:MAG: endolytic transglycosylase MltG [Clostridiales bacterium]|jgi:hypothetical protein|nr:endolytic transglycosylase MltG [Clostridiales bacterium]
MKNYVFGFGAGMLLLGFAVYFIPFTFSDRPALMDMISAPNRSKTVFSDEDAAPSHGGYSGELTLSPAKPAEKIAEAIAKQKNRGASAPEYVMINIPEGAAASKIADILSDGGVVSDSAAFIEYISEKNAEGRLRCGAFSLPKGCAFDKIYSVMAIQ